MRRGALPAELQGLKTVPSAAVTASDYLDKEVHRRRK
jgi:hypothetical protein